MFIEESRRKKITYKLCFLSPTKTLITIGEGASNLTLYNIRFVWGKIFTLVSDLTTFNIAKVSSHHPL